METNSAKVQVAAHSGSIQLKLRHINFISIFSTLETAKSAIFYIDLRLMKRWKKRCSSMSNNWTGG
jgi:hypothetical protein